MKKIASFVLLGAVFLNAPDARDATAQTAADTQSLEMEAYSLRRELDLGSEDTAHFDRQVQNCGSDNACIAKSHQAEIAELNARLEARYGVNPHSTPPAAHAEIAAPASPPAPPAEPAAKVQAAQLQSVSPASGADNPGQRSPDAFTRVGPILLIVLGLAILAGIGWMELRKRRRSQLDIPPAKHAPSAPAVTIAPKSEPHIPEHKIKRGFVRPLLFGTGGIAVGIVAALGAVAVFNADFGNRLVRSFQTIAGPSPPEIVRSCDDIAAHPDDPERTVAGVADENLDGVAIIKSCSNALEAAPDTPRLQFQLARGYLQQDRLEDAVGQLTSAAEAGHGGALALLGDMYVHGADGIDPDIATGRSLLQKAVESGYQPAAQALGEIREVKPEFGNYEVPSFMNAVYNGDYEKTGFDRWRKGAYIINMATAIRQTCRGPFTTAEIDGWRNTYSREVLSSMTPENGLRMMMRGLQVMAEFTKNPASIARYSSNMPTDEEIPYKAQQDAMNFIQDHNCEGAVFDQFTSNMRTAAR